MVYPFWYTGERVFYKPEGFNLQQQIDKLLENNSVSQDSLGFIHFRGLFGLFKLPSKVKMNINIDGTTVQIRYYISLFESNILLLFGLLVALFLYLSGKEDYLVIAILMGVGAYLLNAAIVSTYIKNQIKIFGSITDSVEQQQLWLYQKKWITDPLVCSACGETINQYAANCVNCGMHYKDKKPKSKNSITNINVT